MKILYAASEAAPFAKSGGLADVAGALPKALVRDGIDARVVMPLYGDLKFKDTLTYVTNFSVPVGWRSQYCGLFKAERDGKKTAIRPCLTNALPNRRGGLTVMCDMGANPDVEPWDMVRFAQMGAAYASCVLGVDEPSVGLLSNGTEEHKGSAFTQSCYPLMAEHVPGFAGNCEGGDITSGSVDVVVCNGFDGNIALKSIEGAAKFMMDELKAGMTANLKGKVVALLMRGMLRALKHKLSGDAKGGAILLGLRGVVMIGHGATSAEAVKNGTLACAEAVRGGLVERVRESMGLEA